MSTTKSARRHARPPEISELLQRSLPYNLEAEKSLLGSLVLMPDACNDVAELVRGDEFYDEAHRLLFQTLMTMYNESKKIDVALLREALVSAGVYEKVGGAGYLAEIFNAVPHAAHAPYYAGIVRQKATIRSLIQTCTEILSDAYDSVDDPQRALSTAEEKIFAIADSRSQSSFVPLQKVLHEAMQRIDARMRGEHAVGTLETGFVDLDLLTGGLHPAELVILAARPSMGKTALAMNIAEHVVLSERKPALFVSLEMTAIELIERLLCTVSEVNGHKLRNGRISQEERARLVQKAREIAAAPLFVDDSASRTMAEVAAVARRLKRSEGLGLIVVDYLQLINPDNAADPRQEQVAKCARRLKALARELKVPILCLSQLNRQPEDARDHKPRLSHLRESGAIEQDADVVMFIHRQDYYLHGEEKMSVEGEAELIIAKQRNGPTGEIPLTWRKEFTRFADRAPERHEEFDDFG